MQRVQTYAKADQKSFLKSIAVCRCCRELCGQYNVMISGAEIQFRQINKKNSISVKNPRFGSP